MGPVAWRIPLAVGGPAVHCMVQQRGAVQGDPRDHLGQADMLAPAREVTMVQACEHGHGAIHSPGIVQVGPAPAGGRLPRQPRQKGHPRERLGDGAESGVMVMAAGVPEPRHGDVDDLGIQLA